MLFQVANGLITKETLLQETGLTEEELNFSIGYLLKLGAVEIRRLK